MILTPIQLDEFTKNGYLILRNFADKAECEAILDVAKAHLKHKIEPIETEIYYGEKSQEYRTNVTDYNRIEKDDVVTVRRVGQV
jgi:phytanoyl-CoA hydroxylase